VKRRYYVPVNVTYDPVRAVADTSRGPFELFTGWSEEMHLMLPIGVRGDREREWAEISKAVERMSRATGVKYERVLIAWRQS
jgi:hypothetical protein